MIPLVSSILGFPEEKWNACEMSPASMTAEGGKAASGAATVPLVEVADMAAGEARAAAEKDEHTGL